MGNKQSVPQQSPVAGQGQWKSSFATGYQYVTPDIVSGPNVKKTPGPAGSETWGPYKKQYTKSMFGQDLFTPPQKIDGVPILCRCRHINEYARNQGSGYGIDLGAGAALAFGSHRPACWEDSESIMNPQGGDTFNITLGHPAFYGYAMNRGGIIGLATGFRGFGGGRETKRKYDRNKKKRKTKKRV